VERCEEGEKGVKWDEFDQRARLLYNNKNIKILEIINLYRDMVYFISQF
jgi:hypothetical protein